MGAWGYGPFDNDAAGDMVAALMKKVMPVIKVKTDAQARGYYYEARVAIQFMMIAHDTDILGGPSLDAAIDALARMRRDTEWLRSAREPKQFARALEKDLAAVFARMMACKSCRRAHPSRFKNIRAIIGAAQAVPVPKVVRSKLPKRVSRAKRRRIPSRKTPARRRR